MITTINEFKSNLVNEGTEIDVSEYARDFYDKEKENQYIKDYKFYPQEPVTIVSTDGSVEDDYNTSIEIRLSNGDRIYYNLYETSREKSNSNSVSPPYTYFSLEVDNININTEQDFFEKYFGQTGSMIGDIMLAYENYKKNK